MINIVSKNIQRFIFLVLLQVLILNNIQFGNSINPYFYVLFILMLPFDTPRWLSLLLAFSLGLSVDVFTSTLGLNTAATVFMAYSRVYVLALFSPREGYDFGTQPTIQDMGFTWFISYSSILVLVHHLVLFYVEVFRMSEFFDTLLRVILSFIFTQLLVVISQFLIYKEKRRT